MHSVEHKSFIKPWLIATCTHMTLEMSS